MIKCQPQHEQTYTYKILREIADKEEVSPTDLPLLSKSIDCEALESLLDQETPVTIQFNYNDYEIIVDTEDYIEITKQN